MTVEERFWGKVDRSAGPGGCWLWTASLDTSGYGLFKIAGRLWKAHRYALSTIEPLVDGLVVLHVCDNTRCVNPAHLSQATSAENIADRDAKGRHARHGRGGGPRRLTQDDVWAIHDAVRSGASKKSLARTYGVAWATIHYAVEVRAQCLV